MSIIIRHKNPFFKMTSNNNEQTTNHSQYILIKPQTIIVYNYFESKDLVLICFKFFTCIHSAHSSIIVIDTYKLVSKKNNDVLICNQIILFFKMLKKN